MGWRTASDRPAASSAIILSSSSMPWSAIAAQERWYGGPAQPRSFERREKSIRTHKKKTVFFTTRSENTKPKPNGGDRLEKQAVGEAELACVHALRVLQPAAYARACSSACSPSSGCSSRWASRAPSTPRRYLAAPQSLPAGHPRERAVPVHARCGAWLRWCDARQIARQDYLGTIDPDAAIQMNPEDNLSADDLAANSLHVLDCMQPRALSRPRALCVRVELLALCTAGAALQRGGGCRRLQRQPVLASSRPLSRWPCAAGGLFGKSCNNSFPHMNGGEYYDSSAN